MDPDTSPLAFCGLGSLGEYGKSLLQTPMLVIKRAGYIRDPSEHAADKAAHGEMEKVLNWFHVAMLGTGMIVGAGVFVSTGVAANEVSGPAVVVSLMIAGFAAVLSSLCYSEFAVEFPFAGGAFNYVAITLGEMAAWFIVTTLLLSYILANAAVSRSFSAYFAQLIGKDPSFFVFPWQDYTVDFMAAGLVLVCCIILMFSTGGGSWFNLIVTGSQLVVIAVILITGFIKANPANLTPFLPYGIEGVFNGAGFVFFSFIGFDCVSTLAEEVKNPAVDMPVGIVGCISFVTVLYTLMALCLVMMVPYNEISTDAAFSAAFTVIGYPWAQYLVALGAVLGITTGVLVGMMGQARIACSLSRTHMFFPPLGIVNKRFSTPMIATVVTTIATIPLSILTDLPVLINMVSAGTLAVFAVVAICLVVKRYIDPKQPLSAATKPIVLILLQLAACIGFCVAYMSGPGLGKTVGMAVSGVAVVATAVAMQFMCPMVNKPSYRVPFFPYLPAASLLLNCFLMASLPADSYLQLLYFWLVTLIFYALYSVHAVTKKERAEDRGLFGTKASDLKTKDMEGGDASRGASELANPVARSSLSAFRLGSLNARTGSGLVQVIGRGSGGLRRIE